MCSNRWRCKAVPSCRANRHSHDGTHHYIDCRESAGA
jgi:hypothetical protein